MVLKPFIYQNVVLKAQVSDMSKENSPQTDKKKDLSNGGVVCEESRWKYGCLWILLHGSTWCPGAEFKSIMAVAASMSDSGRGGENMHDGQS